MPWNMQDYPDSLKNFDELLRKKIIDIANALEESGYDENSLIPIAISQGKEWYEEASQEEKDSFEREDNPQKDDTHDTASANPDLLDEDVEVYYEDDQWVVKTVTADQADSNYDLKEDAKDRAQEIADNKGTNVITYTQEGNMQ